MAKVPPEIVEHKDDYKDHIWEQYTLEELGYWVHLFCKRAGHRANQDKAQKDLHDAKNYLAMMREKLEAKTKEVLNSFDQIKGKIPSQ